jgi:hypothetical protein
VLALKTFLSLSLASAALLMSTFVCVHGLYMYAPMYFRAEQEHADGAEFIPTAIVDWPIS